VGDDALAGGGASRVGRALASGARVSILVRVIRQFEASHELAQSVDRASIKKDGKVVQTLTRVVSEDGKTMTVRVKGTNAQGQPVDNVAVREKQ
jgi:ribosomal protein S18